MERLKLFVSTPFRSYGDASYCPDAVFGAGDDAKRRYVDAVLREIGAAAADAEGFEVVEVEFGCGPADALDTRSLADVVRAVRSHFAMAEKPLVHASSIPGGSRPTSLASPARPALRTSRSSCRRQTRERLRPCICRRWAACLKQAGTSSA